MSDPDVFDRTLQTTHIWLNEICDILGPDKQRSYHALRAVLHSLRDNLPLRESSQLAAQFPLMVRGIYFAEWSLTKDSDKDRSRKKFLERVSSNLRSARGINPEDACRAVFRVLNRHISEGELDEARQSLPKTIRTLWPEPGSEEPVEAREYQPAEQPEAGEEDIMAQNYYRDYRASYRGGWDRDYDEGRDEGERFRDRSRDRDRDWGRDRDEGRYQRYGTGRDRFGERGRQAMGSREDYESGRYRGDYERDWERDDERYGRSGAEYGGGRDYGRSDEYGESSRQCWDEGRRRQRNRQPYDYYDDDYW